MRCVSSGALPRAIHLPRQSQSLGVVTERMAGGVKLEHCGSPVDLPIHIARWFTGLTTIRERRGQVWTWRRRPGTARSVGDRKRIVRTIGIGR